VTRHGKSKFQWVPMRKGVAYLSDINKSPSRPIPVIWKRWRLSTIPTKAKRDLDGVTITACAASPTAISVNASSRLLICRSVAKTRKRPC